MTETVIAGKIDAMEGGVNSMAEKLNNWFVYFDEYIEGYGQTQMIFYCNTAKTTYKLNWLDFWNGAGRTFREARVTYHSLEHRIQGSNRYVIPFYYLNGAK